MNRDRYWIVSMPLEVTYLCVNCDTVTNMSDSCPGCGAEANQLMPLWKILNRDGGIAEPKEESDA